MNASLLVSGAARTSVVLLLALAACALMSWPRLRSSAAARRALLVVALVGSLIVPVIAALGPAWRIETPPALSAFTALSHESAREGLVPDGSATALVAVGASAAGKSASAVASGHLDLATSLLVVWLVGVFALLARAVGSRLAVARLVREGERFPVSGAEVDVRLCDELESPAVAGIVHPTVLLPRSAPGWSAERMRVVLVHELAHVHGQDALAQLVADVACALHWFNPLAWMVAARLRIERELAADDAVLAAGILPSSYAAELLAVAGASRAGALAMAERTTLGDRVVAILAAGRARSPLAARGTTLLAVGSVVVGGVAACASPSTSAPPTTPVPTVPAATVTSSVEVPPAASIDASVQAAADDVLASVARTWSAESAVVLVLDAATSQILADAGRVGDHPFDVARSRAITPGSTFKPITIAAALETGAIDSTQLFECGPKPRSYGGTREIHDSSAHGSLDAAHLLAVSSNIGTSHVVDALGGDQLETWLTRFHFGAAPALPGATTGAYPARVATGSLEAAMVGLGEGLTTTPLQMAAAYATFAEDGVYRAPTTAVSASPVAGERIVSSSTARQVMVMLATAVDDPSATGKPARVPGAHVAGKTGTANFTDERGREHTYASFIGIADLPARRVVALVGVDTLRDDVMGSNSAAAFADLITRLRR
jgi:beta-lactamase regulating signal transducer with metallopeptidase domain